MAKGEFWPRPAGVIPLDFFVETPSRAKFQIVHHLEGSQVPEFLDTNFHKKYILFPKQTSDAEDKASMCRAGSPPAVSPLLTPTQPLLGASESRARHPECLPRTRGGGCSGSALAIMAFWATNQYTQ